MTTAAHGAEVPLTRAEYVEAIRSSSQAQGWDPCACCSTNADDLAEYVAGWPVGTIVGRRLDVLNVRAPPSELPA